MALGRPIRVALEARLWRDEKAAGRRPSYGHGPQRRGRPGAPPLPPCGPFECDETP